MTVAVAGGARIGPNAITRTVEALRERIGAGATGELLRAAGLERYGAQEPTAMVPEGDVSALYRALRAQLTAAEASASARLAGLKTARYVLANRIPRVARLLISVLPPSLAAPLLVASITKHTWTFAGSGTVSAAAGPPARIAIEGCPICRDAVGNAPLCDYYAASFEGLFRALVSRRATVTEVACEARGAKGCVFEIAY